MKIFVYAFVLTVLSFTTGLKAQNRSRIPSEKPKLIV
ncbi:hypothetical protein LCGC14_2933080, partial [marine sediment metagenome]